MFRRMARSARRLLMGVRYRLRYRNRNRSRGKWLRMLRKTLLFLRVCGRVRSWMRGRMRMCNISRFRNNTDTRTHFHHTSPTSPPTSPPSSSSSFSFSCFWISRRSKGSTRTITTGEIYTHGATTVFGSFCLFFPRYHLFMLTELRQHYTL